MDPILSYMKDNFLPAGREEARKVKSQSARFLISDQATLYKQSFKGPLLRCITLAEAKEVLEEMHSRICESHTASSP